MNQSRISSFFSPAPTATAYQAQLQRDHDEQSVTAERSAIQRTATGENDEEEVDIYVCLAAAVEDRPIVGVRCSARLSANARARQSLHIAQLLQEQTEEEAVYFPEICVLYDVRSAAGLRVSSLSRFQTSELSCPRVSLPRTFSIARRNARTYVEDGIA